MKRYILSNDPSEVLAQIVDRLLGLGDYQLIDRLQGIRLMAGDSLIVAADVDILGGNTAINRCIAEYLKGADARFNGVKIGFVVCSKSGYYTKNYAQRLAFILNMNGAYFNGHALFEIVDQYNNFRTWQKQYDLSLREVCYERLIVFHKGFIEEGGVARKKVLALHASERKRSNTLALWEMVAQNIDLRYMVKTLHVENGEIVDCKGCDFKTCLHFAEKNSCYYGGRVTKEILPAIEWADVVVWICPNYNDAVSAMHTALINRLTVLYRKISLRHKQIYGVIVSANSGSDVVAAQLINALNFNKGFMVPPKAMICEIANDPGAILNVSGIEQRAADFAKNIMQNSNL